MPDYGKMYAMLFNVITDAVRLLQTAQQEKTVTDAIEILQQSQQKTEEEYIFGQDEKATEE